MKMEVAVEVVKAYGHENVKAEHKTTIEITKDDYLTPRGDCIIGIRANKSLNELSSTFKEIARKEDSIILAIFIADEVYDVVIGKGSSRLTLSNSRKIIIRKSEYIDDSTIMIKSNKAAKDLNRELIDKLKNPETQLYAVFIAFTPIQSTQ